MKSAEALAAQQAAEAAEYQRLQAELQTWCQGTALACLVATLVFYSKVNVACASVQSWCCACSDMPGRNAQQVCILLWS